MRDSDAATYHEWSRAITANTRSFANLVGIGLNTGVDLASMCAKSDTQSHSHDTMYAKLCKYKHKLLNLSHAGGELSSNVRMDW